MEWLSVTSRQVGLNEYKAGGSIVFLPGFTSENTAEFTTVLGAAIGDTTVQVSITGNPLPPANNFTALTIITTTITILQNQVILLL